MLRYASVLILAMATAAPALAQPMSLTASVAVTWITDTYAADQAASEPAFPDWDALPEREDVSMGDVHHPAIVVVWRGQPGWMFQDDDPEAANTLSFSGGTDFSRGPSLVPLSTVSVKQGAVRVEIAYVHATRELTLNGIPVDLPEGHDVVLVDDVDAAPVVVDTIRIGGSEPEWVETFLARSERVLDYIRCDLPLPEDAFGDERFRRGMQRTLDERCEDNGSEMTNGEFQKAVLERFEAMDARFDALARRC